MHKVSSHQSYGLIQTKSDKTSHCVQMTIDEALEIIGTGPFQYVSLCIAGLTFSGNAVEVTLLTFLSPCLQSAWNISNMNTAILSSSVFGGAMVGSIFFGILADYYGRKPSFFVSCMIVFIFGVGSSICMNLESLIFARTMIGFGLGGMTAPFNALAEIIQNHERGKFLLYIEYFWTLGCFYTAFIAYYTLNTEYGWRLMVFLCSLPIMIPLIAGFWVPESPRWLLENGKHNEAKNVILRIATMNGSLNKLPVEWELWCGSDDDEVVKKDKVQNDQMDWFRPLLQIFETRFLMKRTLLIWIVWFCYGVGYYGLLVLIAAPNHPLTTRTECAFHSFKSLFSSFSELIGLTLVIFTIDFIGRKGSQAGFMFIAACSCFFIGYYTKSKRIVMLLSLIARGASLASSSATWVAIPELYPTKCRSTGHSVANVMARIGAFISPYIVSSSLSHQQVAYLISFLMFTSCTSMCILPETVGILLDHAGLDEDELKAVTSSEPPLLAINMKTDKKSGDVEIVPF